MATPDMGRQSGGRCRYRSLLVLLLSVVVVVTLRALDGTNAASVAFEALTWSQWRELYDTAVAARTLERVYSHGPRVRVKLCVAKQISMNQLLAGDAIFRQQLSDVVGTTAERVQLEFLQTNALRASDQGEFVAAFGISALPDPTLSASNDSVDSRDNATATLRVAIDSERERIVQRLHFGGLTARGLNATVAGLTLFGVAATLVDVALDGEAFYPIDTKPWTAARFVVVPSALGGSSDGPRPSASAGGGSPDIFLSRYSPTTDAYQGLRLRFLLAKTLTPLRIETSDIVLRVSTPPFDAYYSDAAAVVEAEIHARDERVRAAVGGYLRNASLAQAFNALEPQWRIAAVDVDPLSGVLYSPPPALTPPAVSPLSSASALEVTLALQNVSFAHVDSYKWSILERFARFVLETGACSECQVSYSRVVPALGSTTDTATMSPSDSDTDTALDVDPLNTHSVSLVFSIDTTHGSLAPSLFTELATLVTTGANSELCKRFGVVALDESSTVSASPVLSTCAVASSQTVSSEATVQGSGEPYVFLNVTLRLTEAALATFESPFEVAASVFEQYRVRCVLLVLLQQVAVVHDDVQLVASVVLADEDEASVLSLAPPIQLSYRVTIRDESQRRGIAQHFFSSRFERTVSEYTLNVLIVLTRAVDLHADGSPSRDDRLPGFIGSRVNLSAALSLANPSSNNASSSAEQPTVRVYRFGDPVAVSASASSTLWNPSVRTFSTPTTTPQCADVDTSLSSLCLSIQFASVYERGTVVYLRQITTNAELSSPSLVMPSPRNVTTPAPPAPWIYSISNSIPTSAPSWVFYANLSRASSTSNDRSEHATVVLRFHFEFVSSLNAPESVRRQLSFLIDVRVVDSSGTTSLAGTRTLVVRKRSFQPLVAGGDTSAVFSNPCVTARVTPQASSQPTSLPQVALTVTHRSVGGFFPRRVLPQCTACASFLTACDALVECTALASCVGAYANSNPALYASMLRASGDTDANVTVSLDTSWALALCVHADQRWTSSTLALFLSGMHCVSSNRCAVDTTDATAELPRRAVVLRHVPMEQTLAFAHENFTTTLAIRVDSTDSDGVVTSQSESFLNLTNDNAPLSALSKTLMRLYGYDGSSRGYHDEDMLTSFVRVSRDTSAGEWLLRIRYFSLSLWNPSSVWSSMELPVLHVLSGDAPLVSTQAAERLELRVENV